MFQIYIYNVKRCSYRRLGDINETEMQPIISRKYLMKKSGKDCWIHSST